MPKRSILFYAFGVAMLAAMACTSASPAPAAKPGLAPTATLAPAPTAPAEEPTRAVEQSVPETAMPTPELVVEAAKEATEPEISPTVTQPGGQLLDPDARPNEYLARQWETDFSLHTVAYEEIRSGGPRRDGIPPIDHPDYAPVSDSPDYMGPQEPVIALEINGDARAYPLAVLIWHEIVNDEVGGVPVSVTYCPLCNTAITFDRRVGEQVLDFGTSGLLRNSDLIMWDRQTESWWQQITGEAIVGELTGTKLKLISAPLISWTAFTEAYPDGQVLTRNTGFSKSYNSPPYQGYDYLDTKPFLFGGAIDPVLPAMERVIGLDLGGEKVAYPFGSFVETSVVHDTVAGQDIVIFFASGTLSAFGGRGFDERRSVGSSGVFSPMVDGRSLSFVATDGVILDEETGSEWNVLGQAVAGELQGKSLEPVVHANHFWFAWQAFFPDSEVRFAEDFEG